MRLDSNAANRYREHADTLRVIAEDAKDRFTRKVLLAVAEDYERMALVREKVSPSNIKLSDG